MTKQTQRRDLARSSEACGRAWTGMQELGSSLSFIPRGTPFPITTVAETHFLQAARMGQEHVGAAPFCLALAKAFDCWKSSFCGSPVATPPLLAPLLVPLFWPSLLPGYVTARAGDTPSLPLCLGRFLLLPKPLRLLPGCDISPSFQAPPFKKQ